MKKDFKTKKKLVITALAVVAVCLTGDLIYYINGSSSSKTVYQETESIAEATLAVPDIEIETQLIETQQIETQPIETQPETAVTEVESTESPTSGVSESKPRHPKEAQPPAEKPSISEAVPVENPDASGVCQPETSAPKEAKPEGGAENAEGKVYVPGFGYVDQPGPAQGETVDTDGDWNKQIGTME